MIYILICIRRRRRNKTKKNHRPLALAAKWGCPRAERTVSTSWLSRVEPATIAYVSISRWPSFAQETQCDERTLSTATRTGNIEHELLGGNRAERQMITHRTGPEMRLSGMRNHCQKITHKSHQWIDREEEPRQDKTRQHQGRKKLNEFRMKWELKRQRRNAKRIEKGWGKGREAETHRESRLALRQG